MIRFSTFLETQNSYSYIDHNDKKHDIDISLYKMDDHPKRKDIYDLIVPNKDLPNEISVGLNNVIFTWHNKKKLSHRENNLPSTIIMGDNNRAIYEWSCRGAHRSNGPDLISTYMSPTEITFGLNNVKTFEEVFIFSQKNEIIERIKEHYKDIQYYKIPNLDLQLAALETSIDAMQYINKPHPDLKKTKFASLVTAKDIGIF